MDLHDRYGHALARHAPGPLSVEIGSDTVTRFRSQKAAGLFAYLALFPRRIHAREELADLFWPDADPEAGCTNPRSALASLRRQLEPPGVEAGGSVSVACRAPFCVRHSGAVVTASRPPSRRVRGGSVVAVRRHSTVPLLTNRDGNHDISWTGTTGFCSALIMPSQREHRQHPAFPAH